MQPHLPTRIRTLDTQLPIWERFFTVAPLVLIFFAGALQPIEEII